MRFSIFRIHVSGEFFSVDYAKAWALTCQEYSLATFWSYTRSRDEDVLKVLAGIPNLRILLSCDRDNWRAMLRISNDYPGFGLSYYSVGEDPPRQVYERGKHVPLVAPIGLVVFVDHAVRRKLSLAGTCPTETAVKAWAKEGACVKCGRCFGQ